MKKTNAKNTGFVIKSVSRLLIMDTNPALFSHYALKMTSRVNFISGFDWKNYTELQE